MQKIFLFTVLLSASISFGNLSVNCTNDNTFLKIKENSAEEVGPRTAELYINFKDYNRIVNLPEVVIHEEKDDVLVNEKLEKIQVSLQFIPQSVTVDIKLEGQKIRDHSILTCE